MLSLTTILIGVAILFYTFDGHTIVGNKIVEKWRRFRQLNRFVEIKYKTIGAILWVSISMVAKMYWMNFIQWANDSIKHIDKKTFTISYVLNGKLYTMVVKPNRGPSSVLLVTDSEHNDVTSTIVPYLGPNEQWHKRVFTPEFWNKEELVFEMSSGDTKTFSRGDIIDLN